MLGSMNLDRECLWRVHPWVCLKEIDAAPCIEHMLRIGDAEQRAPKWRISASRNRRELLSPTLNSSINSIPISAAAD